MAVVMILLPEQTRHGVADFVPMIIVVVFSAEQAGHGIPNLMSFGIVKVRAAEESGMAFSDLLTMLVPVDRVAKQSFVSCILFVRMQNTNCSSKVKSCSEESNNNCSQRRKRPSFSVLTRFYFDFKSTKKCFRKYKEKRHHLVAPS